MFKSRVEFQKFQLISINTLLKTSYPIFRKQIIVKETKCLPSRMNLINDKNNNKKYMIIT